jgi:TRAP transporter TAXI family solute receptor
MGTGLVLMRLGAFLLGAFLSFRAVFPGPALATDLGIVTGGKKGTYYECGLNLRALAKQKHINLAVHPSRGSIENIKAVYQRPGIQMGIVQADVLAFVLRSQTDPLLTRIAQKIRIVFPLYKEEVHLLGRPGIASFDDLVDRRVAIGLEGSDNYVTSRLLFRVAEVTPREMLAIDTEEALGLLKAGRIDAMFYVAGQPVKHLTEAVTESDGLTLIPILNERIAKFYPNAQIPAGTYRWQPQMVETVAVKSLLISFDYRWQDCENVGRFAQVVFANRAWLVQHGHPKWRSVDFDYQLRGWKQYDCVRRYLRDTTDAPRARTGPVDTPWIDDTPGPRTGAVEESLMDTIKQVLGDEATPAGRGSRR